MKITNLHHTELFIDSLEIRAGQQWCFIGSNQSGIDILPDIIANGTGCRVDELQLPSRIGIVSFTRQQAVYEFELKNDDSDFLDHPDPGTLVREYLPSDLNEKYLEMFGLDSHLDQGIRFLSSGQTRKLHLLREIASNPQLLLIQNPFDGLDARSVKELDALLRQLSRQAMQLVLLVNDTNDIPSWSSHLAVFERGRLTYSGPIGQAPKISPHATISALPGSWTDADESMVGSELIHLENGWATYGGKMVFSGLDLHIERYEHTLITGPNGCGKSTLLDLLTGEHQACYSNTLRVFGKQRGTGESIWELKKRMGIVTPGLHRDYRAPATALQVILSGLHDTIGLYDRVRRCDIERARELLEWCGLAKLSDRSFRRLTYAQQRLLLVARGLIKGPDLLLLDEPTQGLDQGWRTRLLDLFEKLCTEQLSTILFVSHRRDEFRPCFVKHLQLDHYVHTDG